jgi:hypothetical protein
MGSELVMARRLLELFGLEGVSVQAAKRIAMRCRFEKGRETGRSK